MVRELKDGTPQPLAPFDLWPLLQSALDRIDIPGDIEAVTRPGERLPKVLSNRKLEDVFFNLLANAVEAMPEGGKLEIGAEPDGEDWVTVVVQDTGRGIPDYLRKEIFTPAFSTKQDEGHGLGLWWSKAFVEKCGGSISVESEVGKGSRFVVRLRAAR
jgi:two-component system NtrC family sensor kinase